MAAGIPDYDEIKLRIEPSRDGAYRVIASSEDGTATGTFTSPFNELELDNFILRVGVQRRTTRGFSSSQMEEAKRFGRRLFESIMQGDVAEAYDGARGIATDHNRGLRIRLELSSVPELMEVPWEFLYDSPTFLAQSIYSPIVRSLDAQAHAPSTQGDAAAADPRHDQQPARLPAAGRRGRADASSTPPSRRCASRGWSS